MQLAHAQAVYAFQRPSWVRAVAAVRRRPHDFVVVEARTPEPVYLFGAIHRRAGVPVFESMPMAGYGSWVGGGRVLPDDRAVSLTREWVRRVNFAALDVTSPPNCSFAVPGPSCLGKVSDFQTHLLTLGDDATMLSRMQPRFRAYMRKMESSGYTFEFGDASRLPEFMHWYLAGSDNWQQEAATLMPMDFFAALLTGGDGKLLFTKHLGTPVGAALFLVGRREVQYQASGIVRTAAGISPMEAMLWHAARCFRDQGMEAINLGASAGLDSVRRFKEKFGAQSVAYRRFRCLLPQLQGLVFASPVFYRLP